MIRLFLCDIDGCLAEPYAPYDLGGFARLAGWGRQADADARYPRIGILSGRSYAYVEAVAQALDLRGPALFESGGGRFDLPLARIRYSPRFTPEAAASLQAVRAFFRDHVVGQPGGERVSIDWAKRTQAGIVAPDPGETHPFLSATERFVTEHAPGLHVYHTAHSIDVVPPGLTKANALEDVAAEEGLKPAEVAFVGDTNGDAAALARAGWGFAPANAAPEAKAVARHVTGGAVLAGVLEAYRICLRHNGVDAAS